MFIEFSGAGIYVQLKFLTGEKIVLNTIAVKVGSDYLPAYVIHYPPVTAGVEVDNAVVFVNQIHQTVTIQINRLCGSVNIGPYGLCSHGSIGYGVLKS